ncbi:histidinol-phosphate transaminase [Govanella unica]|uniref:Histidinol-phosphate aminotransferase n=1 Tax=Govanella unica TaxID=2975056 RepID=A0A9X3Z6W3_9PROT|nr:histidinol-phosphate transaminase [Govania unica]MDA5193428.1 histidinol-phosphate transaminase [Govania unica]
MNAPFPRPGLLDIAAYQPGESTIPGKDRVIKIASNESPLGASPKVSEAVKGGLNKLHLYPEGPATQLRQALATAYGIEAERIQCSNGSEEMLHMLARSYAGPGDEVIYSQYGFLAYPIAIQIAGATAVVVPEKNLHADIDAILAAVTPKTKIVFLANPNNPTGTYLPDAEIRRLHAGLPKGVLLALDEAYAEYATAPDYTSGLELARSADNVVVSRTFSKIYGLAAVRVGWSYCPQNVIDVLIRVRCSFNVNALAQIAACAALADNAHTEAARAHNTLWLPKVSAALAAIGIPVVPSQGNFILAEFKDAADARAADAHLRSDGIIIRPVAGYGLPGYLRITIGTAEENEALISSLTAYKKA